MASMLPRPFESVLVDGEEIANVVSVSGEYSATGKQLVTITSVRQVEAKDVHVSGTLLVVRTVDG